MGKKVAPSPSGKKGKGSPAHRDAPALPEGSGGGGVLRKTEELNTLLRLRNEELVSRENDLTACGEQIESLEAHAEKLQNERDAFENRVGSLTAELERLQAEHNELRETHDALRAEFYRVRAENESKQRVINVTPGIMPVPDAAISAIRRAQHAKDAVKPAGGSGSPDATPSSAHGKAYSANYASGRTSPGSPSSPAAADADELDELAGPPWKLKTWLSTTRILEVVSEALLQVRASPRSVQNGSLHVGAPMANRWPSDALPVALMALRWHSDGPPLAH